MQVGILRAREGDSWLGNGEYRNELVLLESLYMCGLFSEALASLQCSLVGSVGLIVFLAFFLSTLLLCV